MLHYEQFYVASLPKRTLEFQWKQSMELFLILHGLDSFITQLQSNPQSW